MFIVHSGGNGDGVGGSRVVNDGGEHDRPADTARRHMVAGRETTAGAGPGSRAVYDDADRTGRHASGHGRSDPTAAADGGLAVACERAPRVCRRRRSHRTRAPRGLLFSFGGGPRSAVPTRGADWRSGVRTTYTGRYLENERLGVSSPRASNPEFLQEGSLFIDA